MLLMRATESRTMPSRRLVTIIKAHRRGMAGHSKWQNIKHKKKSNDLQRGSLFGKLSRMIETATRNAGGDRDHISVTAAIARARDEDMPKSRIEAAIERGAAKSRDKNSPLFDVMTFELNFHGIGIVAEALSDNHSRTAQEVRAIARKYHATMGADNSVLWNWQRIGLLKLAWLSDEARRDDLISAALEGGAEDIEESNPICVFTLPQHVHSTRMALISAGFQVDSAELSWRPNSEPVPVHSDHLPDLLATLDALDNQADMSAVFHDAQLPS